jgi:hypothetical protein
MDVSQPCQTSCVSVNAHSATCPLKCSSVNILSGTAAIPPTGEFVMLPVFVGSAARRKPGSVRFNSPIPPAQDAAILLLVQDARRRSSAVYSDSYLSPPADSYLSPVNTRTRIAANGGS